MRTDMGLAQFWAQGDAVTHFVAILLLGLSLASWGVIAGKIHGLWQSRRCHARALAAFWGAESLPAAIEAIRREDRTSVLAGLAIAGANAAELHRQNASRGIGAGVSASEFVTRSVRSQIVESQARIESGLTFLASVGSTAPFVGLFGTSGASTTRSSASARAGRPARQGRRPGRRSADHDGRWPRGRDPGGARLQRARPLEPRDRWRTLDGFAHDLHAYLATGLAAASTRPPAQSRGA
jgi:biopolymer transport protein ExbB